ncbi:MAG: endospore germination permease [Alicyclobacillaceae bacterium]|nr:endospore germination permease [Alicyclobacillaceae bacterium]
MAVQRQITTFQATAVLVSTAIGVGMLSLPHFVAEQADTSAPIATFLGAVFALLALWLNTLVGLRFPSMSIVRYSEEVLGRWVGRAAAAVLSLTFVVLTALGAREFGEIVTTFMLHRTPGEVIVTFMLLMAAVSTRHDLTTFVYIHFFYVPFILIPAWITLGIALPYGDPLQVMPVWNGDWAGIGKGTLHAAALFQGAFVMTILIPSMRRPQAAWLVGLAGMFLVGALMVMVVVVSLTILGAAETKQFFWPTLEVIRSIVLPGEILERIDILMVIVWVVAVFTTLFSSYYLSVFTFGEMMKLRDHRPFSFFLLPILVTVALVPQDVHSLYRSIQGVGYFIDAASVGYPVLLLVLAWIRGKGGGARRGQQVARS